MKKIIYPYILIISVLLIAGCLKPVSTHSCANAIYVDKDNVYTAGYDNRWSGGKTWMKNASRWEGGKETALTKGAYAAHASGIFLENGIVYTAGQDSGGHACYWTGTRETKLTSNIGDAGSIYITNGTIYTAGMIFGTNPTACFWIGTKEIRLADGWAANSIFIYNNTVYTAGVFLNGDHFDACYWIRTNRILLTKNGGCAASIFVNKGVVYVAGSEGYVAVGAPHNFGSYTGCCWAGDRESHLGVIVNSVYVYSNLVYSAGQDSNYNACFWTGTAETKLPLSYKTGGYALSLFVYNGIVYTAGYEIKNYTNRYACYWKGTNETIL